MIQLLRPLPMSLAIGLLCLVVSAATSTNEQIGFLLAVGLLGLAAISVPAGAWALCAVVAALTFRGLVTLGALPSVATFVDIPLAWGALAVALLKGKPRTRRATIATRLLIALVVAVFASWAFHPSELIRPILYLALIGQPFALVAALLLDPPSPRLRRILFRTTAALVAVQVPIVAWQVMRYGTSDPVQGTLYGAGAGAHTMSGIVAVAALWALKRRSGAYSWRRLPVALVLLSIPFFADAKQVILALPAILLATNWRRGGIGSLIPVGLVAATIVAMVTLYPSGQYAIGYLEQTRSGEGGKTEAAKLVWSELSSDPASLTFGKGPAETVTRAAFMTTDLLQGEQSPLRVLELHPARIALDVQVGALARSGGGTSFNGALSSALGVFGDLGVVGAATYLSIIGWLFLTLRRQPSPEAFAASAGWAMFAVLGVVFDWWEEPPFSLFLAILTALALTERSAPTSIRRSAPTEQLPPMGAGA